MSKSAEAFRTISEVADVLDTPAHVLRFWESRFTQIKPVKRAGGRRYYRPADVALLSGIKKLLHDDGLTIRGVQKILRQHGVRHVAALAGQDYETEDSAAAPMEPLTPWPETPSPEAARPVVTLLPDPDDTATDDMAGDDLFAAANRPAVQARPGPFGSPLSSTAPGVDARTELQRGREAATQMQTKAERALHRDRSPDDGDATPAAALLRAMTAVRAGRRREELRAIHTRLSELYRSRRDLGHDRSD